MNRSDPLQSSHGPPVQVFLDRPEQTKTAYPGLLEQGHSEETAVGHLRPPSGQMGISIK